MRNRVLPVILGFSFGVIVGVAITSGIASAAEWYEGNGKLKDLPTVVVIGDNVTCKSAECKPTCP